MSSKKPIPMRVSQRKNTVLKADLALQQAEQGLAEIAALRDTHNSFVRHVGDSLNAIAARSAFLEAAEEGIDRLMDNLSKLTLWQRIKYFFRSPNLSEAYRELLQQAGQRQRQEREIKIRAKAAECIGEGLANLGHVLAKDEPDVAAAKEAAGNVSRSKVASIADAVKARDAKSVAQPPDGPRGPRAA